ncbi:variable surface lipoprotein [Metamycoplasma hominis]|uniref:variable surface lipoprotein n=2 Tax=Metamycoplasma hominis TaxID=2098 RepID=UPI003CF4FE92
MRNKIRLLILSAVATSVVAMPLVAAGCKTTDNSQDSTTTGEDSTGQSQDSTTTGEDSTGQSQSGDIIDPNKRAKGQLGQSQLSYIRDQFGFTLTNEGKEILNDPARGTKELQRILEGIINKYKSIDEQIENSIRNKQTSGINSQVYKAYKNVMNDADFVKYFKVTLPKILTPFGHPISIQLKSKGRLRDLPVISYSVICPDKSNNGIFSSDGDSEVPLEID